MASTSDSGLSDAPEHANHVRAASSPSADSSPSPSPSTAKHGDDYHSEHDSALSDADDADAMSEDGNFEEEDSSVKPVVHVTRETPSSSSEESLRPAKRKVAIEDDEMIMKDPELYGIRRSVSALSSTTQLRPLAYASLASCPHHSSPGRLTQSSKSWLSLTLSNHSRLGR